MIIGYGNYVISWTIGGSAGGSQFLAPTDGSALSDGRSGEVQSCVWISGGQSTSSYVELVGTITSPLAATAVQGVIGLINLSLPVGTKVVHGAVTQRLVRGERGEVSAWFVPHVENNTVTIRIYNDVFGAATIVPNREFAIGEIFVGQAIQLPALTTGSNPSDDLQDPTAFNRSAGGQLHQTMRKQYRVMQRQLGPFTIAQASGGAASDLPDGSGDTAGFIDIRGLRSLLANTPVCAVCGIEADPNGTIATIAGIEYNQAFMQVNWMLARPSNVGIIVCDKPPFWSWTPVFMEAT